MNRVQSAVRKIHQAIVLLKEAKDELRLSKNDQWYPIAVQTIELERIYDILTDPECTPEYYEEDDEDENASDG